MKKNICNNLALLLYLGLLVVFACESSYRGIPKLHTVGIAEPYEGLYAYPLFEGCDEMAKKDQKQKCFEKGVHKRLSTVLHKRQWGLDYLSQDSLFLYLNVDIQGKLAVDSLVSSSSKVDFILLKELQQSLDSFPNLKPAIKRGNYTAINFKVPVIFKPKKQD